MTDKFIEYLEEAERTIKTCDHLVYVTFSIVKDKKILIKILLELKKAVAYCINSALQYEYVFKRVKLYQDPKKNFETFIGISEKRFNINEDEVKQIFELFRIVDAHKSSAMEFTRREQVIILSENMQKEAISLDKIKKYLLFSKNIMRKVKAKITLRM